MTVSHLGTCMQHPTTDDEVKNLGLRLQSIFIVSLTEKPLTWGFMSAYLDKRQKPKLPYWGGDKATAGQISQAVLHGIWGTIDERPGYFKGQSSGLRNPSAGVRVLFKRGPAARHAPTAAAASTPHHHPFFLPIGRGGSSCMENSKFTSICS